jgi:hypothetical protein
MPGQFLFKFVLRRDAGDNQTVSEKGWLGTDSIFIRRAVISSFVFRQRLGWGCRESESSLVIIPSSPNNPQLNNSLRSACGLIPGSSAKFARGLSGDDPDR